MFGSFILLGHEIVEHRAEGLPGRPQAGLVFVTTIVGGILGALGADYRARRERRLGGASAL